MERDPGHTSVMLGALQAVEDTAPGRCRGEIRRSAYIERVQEQQAIRDEAYGALCRFIGRVRQRLGTVDVSRLVFTVEDDTESGRLVLRMQYHFPSALGKPRPAAPRSPEAQ